MACAGIIIFNEEYETVLVRTHAGKYSFPKGKRESGESFLDCAQREMSEETGIDVNKLLFVNNIVLNEINDKGNLSVQYIIAQVKEHDGNFTNYDTDELSSVGFVPYFSAIRINNMKFMERRKEILSTAKDYLLANEKNLVSINNFIYNNY
jgi:8-oxo-dGTP pyrophosphatase MutT (NUDIX family)